MPVMRQLAALDLQPRIAVRVESYLAVPYFVVGTDRVALMQERLASRLEVEALNELHLFLAYVYRLGYQNLLIYPFRPSTQRVRVQRAEPTAPEL